MTSKKFYQPFFCCCNRSEFQGFRPHFRGMISWVCSVCFDICKVCTSCWLKSVAGQSLYSSGLQPQFSLKSMVYLFICLLSSFLSIATALRPQSDLFARELPDWQPLIETWKAKGGKHASALPAQFSRARMFYHCTNVPPNFIGRVRKIGVSRVC